MYVYIYIYVYIYDTDDLDFLVILLSKEHSSSKWYIKYTLHPKAWSECGHNISIHNLVYIK